MLEWTFLAVSRTVGWAPTSVLVAAATVLPLQIAQLWNGARHGNYLKARQFGFWVLHAGMPTMLIINL